jgi:hypothetical protein
VGFYTGRTGDLGFMSIIYTDSFSLFPPSKLLTYVIMNQGMARRDRERLSEREVRAERSS